MMADIVQVIQEIVGPVSNVEVDNQIVTPVPQPTTMTSIIKLCIANKPTQVEIDPDYPEMAKCERLLRLLKEEKAKSCLSLWSSLKPDYDVEGGVIYFRSNTVKKQGPIGFRKEIEVFGFIEAINNEAQVIHESLDRVIKKKDHRFELFFFCIYYACRSLGICMLPEYIAIKVGLPLNRMAKAINLIKVVDYNMSAPSRVFTYDEYISVLLDEFELDERLTDVIKIPVQNLLEVDPFIVNKYKPQRIAIAAITYFLNSYRIQPPERRPKCIEICSNYKDLQQLIKLLENHDRK